MGDLARHSRRTFLGTFIPACGLACLGGCSRMAEAPFVEAKHKFKKDWVLTYEEVFEKRYGYYIPLMKRFEEYLGREQLIDMIKRATDESIMAEASDGADFDFRKWLEGGDEYFANMMTWEVVEWTETVYEMRVSECLWCEIFKQEDAAHIGYATVCYSDFASAKATHPNLRLERTKTIMQGDGYCNHRWILDT